MPPPPPPPPPHSAYLSHIEGFWIKNYKALRQITIGSCFQNTLATGIGENETSYKLSPLTLFAGDSGTGKSTILDTFAFLSDCIGCGIHTALVKRGGFEAVYNYGGKGPIAIGIVYRPPKSTHTLTYILHIAYDRRQRSPFIETEAIIYRDQWSRSQPRPILLFQNGEKQNRFIQSGTSRDADLESVKRINHQHLGLAALAQVDAMPDISMLKFCLHEFSVANYVSSNAAKPVASDFKGTPCGILMDNIKKLKAKYPFEFEGLLRTICKKFPGCEKINFEVTKLGRTILTFNVHGYHNAVYATQLSEGTLRLLSHLFLLEAAKSIPFMGLEEPTAFMGRSQVLTFVELVQNHVQKPIGKQCFLTSSDSHFIDQMAPTDVWFLHRNRDGTIAASRGFDELEFFDIDSDTAGPYWYSGCLCRKHVHECGGLNAWKPIEMLRAS